MNILPEAIFDSLSIAHKLDDALDGFERRELHLFSYFSAILFHYAGNPVDDWQYRFIISEEGYPHSKVLSEAIDNNLLKGRFEEVDSFFSISGRGTDDFYRFSKFFPSYKQREDYIDAACSTSFLLPYSQTKNALLNDPNIKTSMQINNDNWISFNYRQLQEITAALGASLDDLTIAAVVWVEDLLKKQNKN